MRTQPYCTRRLGRQVGQPPRLIQRTTSPAEQAALITMIQTGRLVEVAAAARQLTQRYPHDTFAWKAYGIVLAKLQQGEAALTALQTALTSNPHDPEIHNNVRGVLKDCGRLPDAEASYRQALERKPDFAEAHCNLGIVLQDLGRLTEAEASYRQALALKPEYANAHTNLGNVLMNLGRLSEAEISHRRALEFKPDTSGIHNNLGNILKDLNQLPEALACFRGALEIQPDNQGVCSNLLFALAYTGSCTQASLRAEARGWELAILNDTERHTAHQRRFSPPPRLGRPLRIGLLSAELGQHAVAYFLLPWLRALDRTRATLWIYPIKARLGPQVAAFQELADGWTPLAGQSDTEAAARIRADQIDVLIDTSGGLDRRSGQHRSANGPRSGPLYLEHRGG